MHSYLSSALSSVFEGRISASRLHLVFKGEGLRRDWMVPHHGRSLVLRKSLLPKRRRQAAAKT
jgi:hypothetical protein